MTTNAAHLTTEGYRHAHNGTRRHQFSEPRLPGNYVVRAIDTLNLVKAKLGEPGEAPMMTSARQSYQHQHQLGDVGGVLKFIAVAWDSVSRSLLAAPQRGTELRCVLDRLRELESLVLVHQQVVARQLVEQAMDDLARLRECTTIADLRAAVPRAVTRLGFDRAMFSMVQGGRWRPVAAHAAGGAWRTAHELCEDAFATIRWFTLPPAAVNGRTAQVDGRAMLRHRNADAGFELWRRSSSRNFWMVPVVDRHNVVGMIHADCVTQDRLPTQAQVEALRRYCRQLPLVLSTSSPTHVQSRGGESEEMSYGGGPAVVADAAAVSAGPAHSMVADRGYASVLSGREDDVVRLMAEGMTNAQIGRRLGITEGTVKSHVKRILRKMGSANRAEAVAVWLTAGSPEMLAG